jgi:hypothetical protein
LIKEGDYDKDGKKVKKVNNLLGQDTHEGSRKDESDDDEEGAVVADDY